MIARSALFLAIALAAGLEASPAVKAVDDGRLPVERPGSTLPVAQEHVYKMAGRVRALLIWVGRDDVGSGLIRWRGQGQDLAYELLIGSDPARAPGQLNRWGYLAEEVRAGECAVMGVISKSSDSLGEVKAGLKKREGLPFDTIRGRVTSNQAFARVATVYTAHTVTYHEADAVLDLMLGSESDAVKQIDRPNGVRPGFLSSVAEIIRTTVARHSRGERLAAQTIPYVYGDRLYELRLLDATPIVSFVRDGRTYDRVIRARFETGQAGRAGSRFELVYGTSGPLAEIPILISYQPKWWLQVELTIQS